MQSSDGALEFLGGRSRGEVDAFGAGDYGGLRRADQEQERGTVGAITKSGDMMHVGVA
jgi:hypothetical protein